MRKEKEKEGDIKKYIHVSNLISVEEELRFLHITLLECRNGRFSICHQVMLKGEDESLHDSCQRKFNKFEFQ